MFCIPANVPLPLNPVLFLSVSPSLFLRPPFPPSLPPSPSRAGTLAVVGVKLIKFFDLGQRRLVGKKASLGGGKSTLGGKKLGGKIQTFLSVVFINGMCVVGTAGGELYVFRNHLVQWHLRNVIPAHKQSVNALCTNGELVLSGSKDGTVQTWNGSLKVY